MHSKLTEFEHGLMRVKKEDWFGGSEKGIPQIKPFFSPCLIG